MLLSTLATMLRDHWGDNVEICNESVVMKVDVPRLGVYTISITPTLTTGKVTLLAGVEHRSLQCDDALLAVQQCLVWHNACFAHACAAPGP